MLNAFRHHRGRHEFKTWLEGFAERCSTPFGITEVGTTPVPSAFAGPKRAQRLSASQRSARPPLRFDDGDNVCSTPFGITEVGTCRPECRGSRVNLCSTPFGITEVGTGGSRGNVRPASSAQRLSASQRSALLVRLLSLDRQDLCSTPFGITEVGTDGSIVLRRAVLEVLNAFRHHRGRHSDWMLDTSRLQIRAQRLSASQRSAPASPAP